jgi:hypothetical protein
MNKSSGFIGFISKRKQKKSYKKTWKTFKKT